MDEPKPKNPGPGLTESDVERVKNLTHELVLFIENKRKAGEITLGEGMGAMMLALASITNYLGIEERQVLGAVHEALHVMARSAARVNGIFSRVPKSSGVVN
jgi:hypothetical protein